MWKKDNVLRNGNRIALFVAQILIILSCIIYIDYIYITNVLPDKRVHADFVETNCKIISKILNTHGGVIKAYRADFFVSYKTANGKDLKRWAYGNGLDDSFAETSGRSSTVLAQYEVGGDYPCYYDPENPERVVLVVREKWMYVFPFIAPVLILILCLIFLSRTTFKFLKSLKS